MISQEQIKVPNGNTITKGLFTHYLAQSIAELRRYEKVLLGVTESVDKPIQGLKPQDAARKLRTFYDLGSSKVGYEKNIKDLRQFAEENPAIRTMLDVIEERVVQLEEIAKKAPSEILRKLDLEYLLVPSSQ